jgi:radical SAM superfamily enzyme YgiQ (UPF0313 family)
MKHSDSKPIKPMTILLVLLPYWDPMVPPQGISHLKTFLKHHGYNVVTNDANTLDIFKELNDKYFDTLKSFIPEDKRGNFINIGHDVMRNHMMAHLNVDNKKNNEKYLQLLEQIVYLTYYTQCSHQQLLQLDGIISEFYSQLETHAQNLLEEVKPDVLGFSVFRDTMAPSLFMAQLSKEKYPSIQTIMGGSIFSDSLIVDTPNFETFLEQAPYVDKIIIGEGQNLLLKLLRHDFPESQRVFTLKDIDGKTLGFSALSTPDLEDFNVVRDYPYLPAQGSISCPYQCSFCNEQDFWGQYRKKNPRVTVAEMIALNKRYGTQLFFMSDSLLNYTADDISREIADSKVMLYWDGYIKVSKEVSDIDNTLQWRRGGFYRARLGIESGSPHLLEIMNKKIKVEQIKSSVCSLAGAGIKTTTYWVIGHPGETEDDFLQTLDLLTELKNYIYEAECNVFAYRYGGPNVTDIWSDKRKLLYPPSANDMLMMRTWIVDDEPSRQETYSRVSRFAAHCKKLGIPNPYSVYDIYKADERWKKLQVNAVPGFVQFKESGDYIDDTGAIKVYAGVESTLYDEGDFGF